MRPYTTTLHAGWLGNLAAVAFSVNWGPRAFITFRAAKSPIIIPEFWSSSNNTWLIDLYALGYSIGQRNVIVRVTSPQLSFVGCDKGYLLQSSTTSSSISVRWAEFIFWSQCCKLFIAWHQFDCISLRDQQWQTPQWSIKQRHRKASTRSSQHFGANRLFYLTWMPYSMAGREGPARTTISFSRDVNDWLDRYDSSMLSSQLFHKRWVDYIDMLIFTVQWAIARSSKPSKHATVHILAPRDDHKPDMSAWGLPHSWRLEMRFLLRRINACWSLNQMSCSSEAMKLTVRYTFFFCLAFYLICLIQQDWQGWIDVPS